ncbi:MAG: hypothetical protein JXJ04_08160 [Spirochaetales bacterium]|nr:hypothetical protein [Spirochaetales bacterium]
MKYQLETIPIWESYEAETECPLCYLEDKFEKYNLSFFLGGSVMEPDIRERVNESGFCPVHFGMLFNEGNKLSLSLMTHTHLRLVLKKLKKFENKPVAKNCSEFISSLKIIKNECALCNKLEETLKRYTFTIVYLWKKEEDFRKTFINSKGFCLPHFADCAAMANEVLTLKRKDLFLTELYQLQLQNLERIEEEILWFTQKYDYRNTDKPWKNSKDALKRTIQKLTGKTM